MAKFVYTTEVEIPDDYDWGNRDGDQPSGLRMWLFLNSTLGRGFDGKLLLVVDMALPESDLNRFEMIAKSLSAKLRQG